MRCINKLYLCTYESDVIDSKRVPVTSITDRVPWSLWWRHISAMASQITKSPTVCSADCQANIKPSKFRIVSFARPIHWWPLQPVTSTSRPLQKAFPWHEHELPFMALKIIARCVRPGGIMWIWHIWNVFNARMKSSHRHIVWSLPINRLILISADHTPWPPYDHYRDVIMSAVAFQITGVSIVCSSVCLGADQGRHQSSASLVFVRESTGDRWIPLTKCQ